jgi:uncharacterized membrane protein
MNIFQRAFRAIIALLTSPSAEAVEKELVAAAVPVIEVAVSAVAKTNPAVGVAVQVLTPVVNAEITKLEDHKSG